MNMTRNVHAWKRMTLTLMLVLCCPLAARADEASELAQMQQFIEVMQGYYEIIDRIHAIASDREKATIQQLQKIDELYKNRGDRAASIKVMQRVIGSSQSETVRNAVAIMLADALNETGRTDQAIELLDNSITRSLKAPSRP
jgi:predicted negative regulator of RcsB-dependent stress response